jgi:catechol 2,3-dioxygenase
LNNSVEWKDILYLCVLCGKSKRNNYLKGNVMQVKELGHIVLYVRDLERSRHFYRDVLGWRQLPVELPGAALFSSGRTHHELLLLEVGATAAPIPPGRRVGLYHFGLKVGETDEELRQALATLVEQNVKVVGTADHTVTHSLYIEDPDGNEIELYIDVQPATWKKDPAAMFAAPRPLRL